MERQRRLQQLVQHPRHQQRQRQDDRQLRVPSRRVHLQLRLEVSLAVSIQALRPGRRLEAAARVRAVEVQALETSAALALAATLEAVQAVRRQAMAMRRLCGSFEKLH